MQQHQYMMALDRKVREINGQYVPDGGKHNKVEEEEPEKIDEKDVKEAE